MSSRRDTLTPGSVRISAHPHHHAIQNRGKNGNISGNNFGNISGNNFGDSGKTGKTAQASPNLTNSGHVWMHAIGKPRKKRNRGKNGNISGNIFGNSARRF